MAEPTAEARIRDLERRLDLDSGSRLFVSLAEEYRKAGRFRDALSALQKGLLAHPGYIAAQVALGRVYLENNSTTDAIATFTKVLVADPGNLVAAKSLADIHLSRGDKLEAVKKYKLYRALSGDRKIDEIVGKLEAEVAPRPVTPSKIVAPVEPPPPPSFQETDKSRRRPPTRMPAAGAAAPLVDDPFDITSVAFEIGEDSGKSRVEDPFPFIPTRDVALTSSLGPVATFPAEEASTRGIPVAEAMASRPGPLAPGAPEALPGAAFEVPRAERPEVPAALPTEPAKPTGRALADLYYSQGHYAEALQIYDDLVTRHPFDEDLKRLRRDSEARLLPAGSSVAAGAPGPDLARDRRQAKIRALQHWLSSVQAG